MRSGKPAEVPAVASQYCGDLGDWLGRLPVVDILRWGRAVVAGAMATLLPDRLRNDRDERPLASYGERSLAGSPPINDTPELCWKKEQTRSMRGLGKKTELGEQGERLILETSGGGTKAA